MIVDNIKNYGLYAHLSEKISKAFNFIVSNDLKQMELGTYEIEGDDIFAMLQEYDTKEEHDCKLEGHYKYIDLQYMVTGSEQMGFSPLSTQIPTEINEEKDYAFYAEKGTLLTMTEGMFAVFYPHDLHMPCVKSEAISKIRKVVVKIGV